MQRAAARLRESRDRRRGARGTRGCLGRARREEAAEARGVPEGGHAVRSRRESRKEAAGHESARALKCTSARARVRERESARARERESANESCAAHGRTSELARHGALRVRAAVRLSPRDRREWERRMRMRGGAAPGVEPVDVRKARKARIMRGSELRSARVGSRRCRRHVSEAAHDVHVLVGEVQREPAV